MNQFVVAFVVNGQTVWQKTSPITNLPETLQALASISGQATEAMALLFNQQAEAEIAALRARIKELTREESPPVPSDPAVA